MKITVSELEISAEELRANRTLGDVVIQTIINAFDRVCSVEEEPEEESEEDE